MLLTLSILLVSLVAFAQSQSSNFIMASNASACGQNFELFFELFPLSAVDSYGGIFSIESFLSIYFSWSSSYLTIRLNTNQGSIVMQSNNQLQLGQWAIVRLTVRRRSLALDILGTTSSREVLAAGHMHSRKLELDHFVDVMVDQRADAVIRGLFMRCLAGHDRTEKHELISVLHRKDVLKTCSRVRCYEINASR